MSSRRSDNWKANYESEIRKLVIKRNRRANKLGAEGLAYNATEIPKLNWKDVTGNITTKADYKRQVRILSAFLDADSDFQNMGAVTVATPFVKELQMRVRLHNEVVQKEKERATKLAGLVSMGGKRAPSLFMGDERYKGREITDWTKQGELNSAANFQEWAKRTVNRTSEGADNARQWQEYKDNYIKGLERITDNISDPDELSKAEALIRKLRLVGNTKFRDLYYGDVLGDIDYLASDQHDTESQVLSKLNTIANMFGVDTEFGASESEDEYE